MFSGYLQFTIPGGNGSKGGVLAATKDENSFIFANKANNALATQIKEHIETKVHKLRTQQVGRIPVASLSDEIEKLSKLRDSGILSEQEFNLAKTRLIS